MNQIYWEPAVLAQEEEYALAPKKKEEEDEEFVADNKNKSGK